MGKLIDNFFKGNLFKGDKGVWMIYFFLCMISLVEVYSASSRLTFNNESHMGPMINQAGFLFVGLLGILIIHRIPCKWFMVFPIVLLPLSLFFLILAALGWGGGEINETNRWVKIAGISFQPSEIAKLSLIMSVAVILAKTQAEKTIIKNGKERTIVGAIRGKRHTAFTIVSIMTMIVCGLIFADNVSTALMLFAVIVVMMFIAHVPLDLMFKGATGLIVAGALYFALYVTLPENVQKYLPLSKRLATVEARLKRMGESSNAKLDADNMTTADVAKYLQGKDSQSTYAYIAVANSNVIGRGPGNSIERDFLQHAESDFIFAIIVEEFGILGAICVLFLYFALLMRCGRIAQRCRLFFPAYLVLGYGIMMTLQALTNMGVAVGLLPVTGQTLPLVSKGGTSILIISFYIGTILSVSRHAESIPVAKRNGGVQLPASGETQEYMTDGAMV